MLHRGRFALPLTFSPRQIPDAMTQTESFLPSCAVYDFRGYVRYTWDTEAAVCKNGSSQMATYVLTIKTIEQSQSLSINKYVRVETMMRVYKRGAGGQYVEQQPTNIKR